jgi:hypothetical protein
VRKTKRDGLLRGVCSACGRRKLVPLSDWRAARYRDSWPVCSFCTAWLYPIKRKCLACNAVLRNGNLGNLCGPCERKYMRAGFNGADDGAE